MSAVTTIPVTIEPDAAARVAELGMQREFEQMLEHARQAIRDLRRIEVTLAYPPDYEDDPRVIIEITCTRNAELIGTIYDEWCTWVFSLFSPDVIRHFTLIASVEAAHGR